MQVPTYVNLLVDIMLLGLHKLGLLTFVKTPSQRTLLSQHFKDSLIMSISCRKILHLNLVWWCASFFAGKTEMAAAKGSVQEVERVQVDGTVSELTQHCQT